MRILVDGIDFRRRQVNETGERGAMLVGFALGLSQFRNITRDYQAFRGAVANPWGNHADKQRAVSIALERNLDFHRCRTFEGAIDHALAIIDVPEHLAATAAHEEKSLR